jgi:adenylate cyclase
MPFILANRPFLSLLIYAVVGAGVGVAYATATDSTLLDSVCIGIAITTGISMFEQYFVRQPWGRWLRRAPLLVLVGVTALVWMIIIVTSLYFIPTLLGAQSGWFSARIERGEFATDMIFSSATALLVTTAIRLRTLVGGRVLFNFLTGRYRHPVEEQRLFLFMDLADSTTIAERLGSVRYHAFLRDFIETVELCVADYRGEIYQYVGDQVVITWPLKTPRANARAALCYFAIVRLVAKRRQHFNKRYQALPTFAGGIHCGEVVAGEIGDHRRQIVYVGDVVNTAARIEAKARADGVDLMMSAEALQQTALPQSLSTTNLGEFSLKGKQETVSLLTIEQTSTPEIQA